MKKYITLSLICLLFFNSYSQNNPISGTIQSDTTWSGSVDVVGDVFINSTATLNINPGTIITLYNYYKIDSEGYINAIGNQNDSITFTVNDTSGFHNVSNNQGGWEGIKLRGSLTQVDTSVFKYCNFYYSKAFNVDSSGPQGCAIAALENSKVKILNSYFKNNIGHIEGGAVRAYEADFILISDCFLTKNYSTFLGGAIFIGNSMAEIYNCQIYDNDAEIEGGGINCRYSDIIVRNNVISNNATINLLGNEYGSGGGICFCKNKAIVINNLICNNSSSSGGAVEFTYTNNNQQFFLNNTVVNNYASEKGGAFYMNSTNSFNDWIFKNSILWGNYSGDGKEITSSHKVQVSNCVVQGGYDGDNNLDIEPRFVNPTEGPGQDYDATLADWRLRYCSHCIDNGAMDTILPDFDYYYNPRVVNSNVDIGAIEYQDDISNSKISGHITLDGSIFTEGYVRLYEYSVGTMMPIADEVAIDENGDYEFSFICDGNYVVVVYPDQIYLNTTLKKYYTDADSWNNATIINFDNIESLNNIDINLTGFPSLNGDNEISGLVVDVNDQPLENVEVILKQLPDSVIGRRFTSELGEFKFILLPAGDYEILVDIPGLPMDSVYIVNLNKNKLTEYKYVVDSTKIYIESPYGVTDFSRSEEIQIYPNPTHNNLLITYYDKNSLIESYEVFNTGGELVLKDYNLKIEKCKVDISHLPKGVYFIKVSDGNKYFTSKFVKI